jgi:hypothetical protein
MSAIVGESVDEEKRVSRIYGVVAGLCLACSVLPGVALADSQWRIAAPYPGNPLKVAALDGQGTVGRKTFPVVLELSCHPDAAVPRAVLRVPLDAGGWDMSVFDGASGGAGQRLRTLAVYSSNRRLLDRPRFSGVHSEPDSFLLNWQPSDGLLARIGRPGDGVQLRLTTMHRSQGRLEARFVFPADTSDVISALAPCSKVLHVPGKTVDGK